MPTDVTAPLIGTVVHLPVAVGDSVSPGGTVAVLESMKMEHPVRSKHGGVTTDMAARLLQLCDAHDPPVGSWCCATPLPLSERK